MQKQTNRRLPETFAQAACRAYRFASARWRTANHVVAALEDRNRVALNGQRTIPVAIEIQKQNRVKIRILEVAANTPAQTGRFSHRVFEPSYSKKQVCQNKKHPVLLLSSLRRIDRCQNPNSKLNSLCTGAHLLRNRFFEYSAMPIEQRYETNRFSSRRWIDWCTMCPYNSKVDTNILILR